MNRYNRESELVALCDTDFEYVAFDLETTGLVAQRDRVVEIGAVRFRLSGQVTDQFEQLVNPGRSMSPAAQAIHDTASRTQIWRMLHPRGRCCRTSLLSSGMRARRVWSRITPTSTQGSWEANCGGRVIRIPATASSIRWHWLDVAVPNCAAIVLTAWQLLSICNAGPRIELWRTLFVSRISGSGFTDPPRPASCLFLTPSMTPGKPLRLLTAGTCSITQLPRAGRSALRTTAERAAFPLARSPRVVSCKKGAWRTWWHTATWILWKNRFGWIGSGIARSWRQPNLPTAMLIHR